jgi:hypothetical protein
LHRRYWPAFFSLLFGQFLECLAYTVTIATFDPSLPNTERGGKEAEKIRRRYKSSTKF